MMITEYDFYRTKYGEELLIDLIGLEDLENYIRVSPVQRLSYYDITVVADGSGTFAIDDEEREIESGSVFFSSPNQVRRWNAVTMPKGYVLIFEDEFIGTFFNDNQFVKHLSFFNPCGSPHFLKLTPDDYHKVAGLMLEVKNEILSFRNSDKHILRALLYQVLIFLNRIYLSVYPGTDRKSFGRYIDRFIQLVEVNHHQHRAVDYYARQLHITGGHLNSLVKDSLGVSAKKFILNRNILEAKRLLRYTDLSINQVADRLNYENTTYFIRMFREHAHITPLRFRRQINP